MPLDDSLVAFFDILGTKEAVRRGDFSDFHVLDFANAAGITAMQNTDMRFAAFSDSIVISCPTRRVSQFLTVLNFLCSNWLADFIFVRGGLSVERFSGSTTMELMNVSSRLGTSHLLVSMGRRSSRPSKFKKDRARALCVLSPSRHRILSTASFPMRC